VAQSEDPEFKLSTAKTTAAAKTNKQKPQKQGPQVWLQC
jgi:hypothetical protein